MHDQPNGNQPAINMISEGTLIEGKINTENDFRISGRVDGTIKVKGKTIISKTGRVTGDIQSGEADISGTVEGKIVTGSKLILRQTAKIKGDIFTKKLIIEEGATFDGNCSMNADPLKNQPGKNSRPATAEFAEKEAVN